MNEIVKKDPRILALGILAGLALFLGGTGCRTTSNGTGDTGFLAYEGRQTGWPTTQNALVEHEFALPVYHGLPPKRYEVIGRVIGTQRNIIGRGLAEGLWSDRDRLRDVCAQARQHGADAVLLTENPVLMESLRLPSGEIRERESPLYDFRGAVVAIRWRE